MDIGRGRSVCLVAILGIIVQFAASDSQVCRVQERLNMGLSKIQDPAQILSVAYEFHTAPDCYQACCNFTNNQCNAVSFYDKESLCMMLNCRPFKNCVWVPADGFAAARIQMATVAGDVPPPSSIPPSVNDPMASTTTSQLQQQTGLTTPQALTQSVPPTTTTQANPLTTIDIPGGVEVSATQPLNPGTSVQQSAAFDSTNSSEAWTWNMNGGTNVPPAETTPIGLSPTVISEQTATPAAIPGDGRQPDDQQQQQQEQHFDDVFNSQSMEEWESPDPDTPAPSNPEAESISVPLFIPDSSAGPSGMRRILLQSPGIIIGLCSALGVAFLVLLAVCRKVYLGQDRPHYKPLRDYDIRFEPPAASSALLP